MFAEQGWNDAAEPLPRGSAQGPGRPGGPRGGEEAAARDRPGR